MKFLKSFLIANIFAMLLCAAAMAEGYIFKYSEDVYARGDVMPMSVESGQRQLYDEFYYSEDEDELKRLLEAGIIDYYGPDCDVWLMDDTNDPDSDLQAAYELNVANAVSVVNNGKYDGRGVTVGIIDTGLKPGLADIDYTHVKAQRDITPGAKNPDDATDIIGHGTAVTGIVAAVTNNGVAVSSLAPGVDLVVIKVFPDRAVSDPEYGATSVSNLLLGLQYAEEQGCDVINMSVGTLESSSNKNTLNSMNIIIDRLSAKGTIVVASAGNHDKSHPQNHKQDSPMMYPAAFDNVISVSSVGLDGSYASYTYHNSQVDIAAPGGGGGTNDGVTVLDFNSVTGTKSQQGTSFASPLVAAAAALTKQVAREQGGDVDIAEFKSLLAETAVDVGEPGRDKYYGYGVLNVGGLMDRMLGNELVVQTELRLEKLGNNNVLVCEVTNNGFDIVEVMDIWYLDDGNQGGMDIRDPGILPRGTAVLTMQLNPFYKTVHMLWDPETLEPLCKKQIYEPLEQSEREI